MFFGYRYNIHSLCLIWEGNPHLDIDAQKLRKKSSESTYFLTDNLMILKSPDLISSKTRIACVFPTF